MTSSTISVEWLCIDLGHLATCSDTIAHTDCSGSTLTRDQQAIYDELTDEQRANLCKGGRIAIPAGQTDDDWVALQLSALLSVLLGPKRIDIDVEDVILPNTPVGCVVPMNLRTKAASTSPNSGTHCRLRGDRWVNERTYMLFQPAVGNGTRMPWLSGKLTENHIATATLVWVCRDLTKVNAPGAGAV